MKKKKKIFVHMKVQEEKKNIGTHEGPKVLKKDEHMKAHIYINDSHVSK
jgi:hypothetical protein